MSYCTPQSIDELPPSGEALKILAKYLGGRVNTKYSVRQKQHNQTVEKLNNIYDTYTDLVAKDGKVEYHHSQRLLISCLRTIPSTGFTLLHQILC